MISHYLMFNRNCSEALDVYAKAFAGTIAEKQTYSDMPSSENFPVAEADRGLVMHSRLSIDGAELMCADASEKVESGDNMYISITTQDEQYIRNAWEVLKDGAEIYMDLSPSFFAKAHGSMRDKFGISWMFTVMN